MSLKYKKFDVVYFYHEDSNSNRTGIVVGDYPSIGEYIIISNEEIRPLTVHESDIISGETDYLLTKFISNALKGIPSEKLVLKRRKRFWEVWKWFY